MRIRMLPLLCAIVAAGVMLVRTPSVAWTNWTFGVLYRFGSGLDGIMPEASVITDAHGNVYGTTVGGGGCAYGGILGCGTVFKLNRPAASGQLWNATILHAFSGADGYVPSSPVIADALGTLYGTTQYGGSAGAGVVYALVRSGPTTYDEHILHTFSGGLDGASPGGGFYQDARGNIYGETGAGGLGFGTIFKLAAPAAGSSTWTFRTLYAFTNANGDGAAPSGGLVGGPFGILYGVTNKGGAPNPSSNGYGTVFALIPPEPGGTAWTERVLYAFRANANGKHPSGPLLIDRNGNLFGITTLGGSAYLGCGVNGNGVPITGCGTVFELSPPAHGAHAWGEHVLFAFGAFLGYETFAAYEPSGSLVEDSAGRLYGTTTGGGTNGSNGYGKVFRLTPPVGGGYAYTETDIESFNEAKGSAGSVPVAGLYPTAHALFGTTESGARGFGEVFELVAQ